MDEQPFLDAVFARYHDDGPRLVYADFLEDAGDPERAELVRVQLALARLPDDHPRRPDLAEREAELLAAHRGRWTDHLRDLGACWVDFRRGVLDSVSVDAAAFLDHGAELLRRVPVRRLRLLDAARAMPKLAGCPLLAAVRELDLCANDLGNGGVTLLARSPVLKHLDALHLGFNGLDDAGVAALARSAGFPALTALALNDNGQVTADGLKALADSPFFGGLASLDVSGNDVSDAGVRAVAAGGAFPRLHTLRVNSNPIGDAGVAALAQSPLLGRMLAKSPAFELRKCGVGPLGAAVLAARPALARCTALDLSENYLGEGGFRAVVGSPHLGNLRVLKLGRNQIPDAAVARARDALPALLARLHLLDLSGNRLTRLGIDILRIVQGDRPVNIDWSGNVQTPAHGETPVAVGDVVPGVLDEVAEAAALRRRVSHPAARRPPPHG